MFRKVFKKRTIVLGAVAILAVAGIAIAYWTTTGAGTGSGSVKTSNGTLVLNGTITNGLAPGVSSPVTFTADNSNSSSLQVGTIHAVVSTDKPGCTAADFTIADTPENQTIPANTPGVSLAAGSITMIDAPTDQEACKGAKVTLTLTTI